MGGSGGGGGWYRSPSATSEVEKAVSDATTSSGYEAEANAYLQDLLASYNSRDVVATMRTMNSKESATIVGLVTWSQRTYAAETAPTPPTPIKRRTTEGSMG